MYLIQQITNGRQLPAVCFYFFSIFRSRTRHTPLHPGMTHCSGKNECGEPLLIKAVPRTLYQNLLGKNNRYGCDVILLAPPSPLGAILSREHQNHSRLGRSTSSLPILLDFSLLALPSSPFRCGRARPILSGAEGGVETQAQAQGAWLGEPGGSRARS